MSGVNLCCMQNFVDWFIRRYLTGNPCTEYEGYWEYVIATLPRLQVCSLLGSLLSSGFVFTMNL